MSDRFWRRNLRHLNPAPDPALSGVTVRRGKSGNVVVSLNVNQPDHRPHLSEAETRANLMRDLARNKKPLP